MSAKSFKVMVIDDDVDTCELMKSHLEHLDGATEISVHTECNGELGLAAVNATRYDLIITDFLMPNMNGLEMITEIRKGSGCNQATPIICITGHLPMIDDKIPAHIMSNVEFIEKPYDVDELYGVLKDYLKV